MGDSCVVLVVLLTDPKLAHVGLTGAKPSVKNIVKPETLRIVFCGGDPRFGAGFGA